MDMEITSRKDNRLLKRADVQAVVKHSNASTPAREDVRDALSKSLGVNKESLVIASMKTSYGKHETTVYARTYGDKETALKLESRHILVRNKLAEKKQAAPKAAKKQAK
ncbi:MAG: 30S ribosomal protein S24e [Thermoplasmata archaeon]|nr:30S ribosomal protein S24e [Candidatus Sysuiplasma acidicola]MBX8645463.1 30S ribosomal protein S24e [Candidatus Sysuiplasma acidicola]